MFLGRVPLGVHWVLGFGFGVWDFRVLVFFVWGLVVRVWGPGRFYGLRGSRKQIPQEGSCKVAFSSIGFQPRRVFCFLDPSGGLGSKQALSRLIRAQKS